MASNDQEDLTLVKLETTCFSLKTLLQNSAKMKENLTKMDDKFDSVDNTLTIASRKVTPLQSLSMATKALETRINRAVTPALALLESFKISDTLQHKLIEFSSKLSTKEKTPKKRLKKLIKYVNCVDNLNEALNTISQEGEPVIQRLQEVVEFLSRTKAADQNRTHRLRETLVTLKALYETEMDAMRFEGLLDEALLSLQDEFEIILQQIKHENLQELDGDEDHEDEMEKSNNNGCDLGNDLEVEALKRIVRTLAVNDCLDICIDIFIKVRYRRAAKALMRLNPEYLRTYTPEQIDDMEWESLETSITFWIQHFEVALTRVLISEKKLCNTVLGDIAEGLVWPECFIKIADKIMAVFFRFGEGVARSSKEPQKLFKLLDMFDSLEKLKPTFSQVFDGESGEDICTRFRELEKLLIHSSSRVFWEFGLQIEGNSDGFPPPEDGSVPKIVRYAINYLKFLTTENYSVSMAKVLRTEQVWKTGIMSKPENDENLLKDAIFNIMEALQRNVESKRCRYNDKTLPCIFAMNTYWYIYMRTRNTELGKLIGERYMKKKCKIVAEEAAYLYQMEAWGPLVKILDKEDFKGKCKEEILMMIRAKVEAFTKGLDEILKKHNGVYNIPDFDLREQIREATVKFVVPVYTEFFNSYLVAFRGKLGPSPESIQDVLGQIFEDKDGKFKPRDSKDRTGSSVHSEQKRKDFQRSKSNASDV